MIEKLKQFWIDFLSLFKKEKAIIEEDFQSWSLRVQVESEKQFKSNKMIDATAPEGTTESAGVETVPVSTNLPIADKTELEKVSDSLELHVAGLKAQWATFQSIATKLAPEAFSAIAQDAVSIDQQGSGILDRIKANVIKAESIIRNIELVSSFIKKQI